MNSAKGVRHTVDLRGERCPYTFIKARLAMEELAPGDALEVWLDFVPAFERVPASMQVLGHRLVSSDGGVEERRLVFECGTGDTS
jgi:tRNA 2-thiouridine synthesizing protein A